MDLRSLASLVSVSTIVLAACGPEKGSGEGDTGTADTTADTTQTSGVSTDDAPTTTGMTGMTDTTDTGTTGEPGQPLFCDGESPTEPACVDICVRDVSPETPVVDANCRVVEVRADMSSVEVPKCIQVMDNWQVPAGAGACFALRIDVDGAQTPSAIDDMSPECADAGANAEVMLVRSEPPMPGACAFVTCDASEDVTRDCPNL